MTTTPRLDAILDAVSQDATVLDVGCVQHDASAEARDNWLHKHLCQHTNEVTGLDYLADDVAELNDRGYDVVHADAHDFELDGTFDVIVAGELIEHLVNFHGFLDSCRQHLRADGRLVLTTPNPWALVYIRRAVVQGEAVGNDEHTCWFDATTLTQLLEREGYRILEIDTVRPSAPGVSRVLYDTGFKTIGGTRLIAVATPES